MDGFLDYLDSIGIDMTDLLKGAAILIVGVLLLALTVRFIFGLKSNLNHAISSAIGIIFVYGVMIGLNRAGPTFQALLGPMPFLYLSGEQMILFNFGGAEFAVVCTELLSMVILAFLVNLVDWILPRGKGFWAWLLFRILTIILGLFLHLIVTVLFNTYAPENIATYAPMILLGILLVLLLTGALKIFVGKLLSAINPVISALYTFFFANVVGKQITRSVMTTGILILIIYGLHSVGIHTLSLGSAALISYLPILLLLIGLWYLVNRVLSK